MPDLNTFKIAGNKIVPINRFNLEEGKLSSSFSTVKEVKTPAFTVVAHPILTSIAIQPALATVFFNREYFPLIEDNTLINHNTLFSDFNDNSIKLQFPDIEIIPLNNNQVFYYENVLNEKSENIGFLGKVTLNYNIKNKTTTDKLQNIPLQLKEVILNLKVKDNIIKINGFVDEVKKEIIFNIKDEAIKIAFLNLVTNIEELKCSIDLFFSFKGYAKARKFFHLAKNFSFNHLTNLNLNTKTIKANSNLISQPLFVSDKIRLKDDLQNVKIDNQKVQTEYVRSTFLLKINKQINYPLATDATKSLYQTIGGGFITNPFNFNEDFSLYEQIFVPGINLDKLSIYKSKVTTNEFLLISKRYNITRSLDTKKPCINTIFHGTESDSGLSNDISKINFQFAIGPDLSDFDLNKIKIDLFNNKFLDKTDTINYFDKISFIYPNEIESKYEINGNQFLQNANVTIDGKYFLVDFSTENLNDASILINSINNNLSQYANINFIHKEIKDTSIIELNIQKTIGEVLLINIDNVLKKASLKNESLSPCKINSVLVIDETDKPLFSSSLFSNYTVDCEQTNEISFNNIQAQLVNKNLNKIFFDFESIENLSKEFSNLIATSNNFNKYIQIQFQTQKAATNRIQIELIVNATSAIFNIERLKADFKMPMLINFLLSNTTVNDTRIKYKANYFDKDNNIVTTFEDNFDYSKSAILTIPKK